MDNKDKEMIKAYHQCKKAIDDVDFEAALPLMKSLDQQLKSYCSNEDSLDEINSQILIEIEEFIQLTNQKLSEQFTQLKKELKKVNKAKAMQKAYKI